MIKNFIILFLIFCINLSFDYYKFKNLTPNNIGIIKSIKHKISKNKKKSLILKISTKDFDFYTKTYKNLDLLVGDEIKLRLILKRLNFIDYLKGSFIPSYDISVIRSHSYDIKNKLSNYILSQHSDNNIGLIHSALFLATPLNNEIRESFANFGISHLIAISGFHLGVIFAFLYFVFDLIYKKFHHKFSYRNKIFDISVVIFIFLFCYLYILDFSPSFLRAYVMSVVGFLFLCRGERILNFYNLFLSVGLIIALCPKMIFSISLFLSFMGVNYLFLYLKFFKRGNFWDLILINFYIYLSMIIVVVSIFDKFYPYSIYSVLITPIFVIFYILDLIFHILNLGYLSDFIFEFLLSYNTHFIKIKIPTIITIFYIILSLIAIRFRLIATILPLFGLCLFF